VECACQFVSRAAADGANLIGLPEFFNCEYLPRFRDYDYDDWGL
jgi:predicted amidohydrolase